MQIRNEFSCVRLCHARIDLAEPIHGSDDLCSIGIIMPPCNVFWTAWLPSRLRGRGQWGLFNDVTNDVMELGGDWAVLVTIPQLKQQGSLSASPCIQGMLEDRETTVRLGVCFVVTYWFLFTWHSVPVEFLDGMDGAEARCSGRHRQSGDQPDCLPLG